MPELIERDDILSNSKLNPLPDKSVEENKNWNSLKSIDSFHSAISKNSNAAKPSNMPSNPDL